MSIKTFFYVVVPTAILSAFLAYQFSTFQLTKLSHAPVPGAKRLDCNSANPNKCHVNIKCRFGVCWFGYKAEYEEIHLARGSKDLAIVWHLPGKYAFCQQYTSDGGVVLKGTNDNQFNQMYSTEDMNGGQPSVTDCKKHEHFHWTAKNDAPRPNDGYGYTINFYDDSGTPQQVDPWIFND
jgi:hypothetical protein